MFDYSVLHWTTFLAAALALTLAPGPDIAFILGQTVAKGRRAGAAAMFGIWTGALVHVLFAAAGLSALLASSAVAFSAVKWVGAAYLVYLGVMAFWRAGGNLIGAASSRPAPMAALYRQGALICILNPKVAIFFLAFLPQFVVPGQGPVWAQLVLHGFMVIVVSAVVEPPLVLLGDRLARVVRARPGISAWIDRALGDILVGFGLKLAFSEAQGG